ncbi:MAG TPA: class I SAM-dependent methyltransferase [Phycisphaerae bacterium]|nr:class I SAM-dependent methyltransferase [Phycisphaerae bacterium]
MTRWYEALFANYARTYDREPFTQGTPGEVDFVEREIGSDRTRPILDIGCGTGRHAIELARRGYAVTGIDLSAAQLARARVKAADAGVHVTFEQRDATQAHFVDAFDLAIMFCEGAFSLMETDALNHAVLAHAATALRPGGKLLLTTLNALFPLTHSVKDFYASAATQSTAAAPTFDLLTFRERTQLTFTDDAGATHTIDTNERYYTPPELRGLLEGVGFAHVDIFGAHLGDFSRAHALTPDDFEMLAVAVKAT